MSIDGDASLGRDDNAPAATGDAGERAAGQTGSRPGGENDARSQQAAEPLTREEYADAMRAGGPAIRHDAATVTHFHAEFKGRPLDLYTDGIRWATADTPPVEETESQQGDIPDRLPTGGELVDSAGDDSSRIERLRREIYRESGDELDGIEKNTKLGQDIFSHQPTGSYEGTPTPQPHIYASQHSGIDAGSVATAIFTFGLVIDRAAHWAMEYYDKHRQGDNHAGSR